MSTVTLEFRELDAEEEYGSLCGELEKFLTENASEFEGELVGDLSHIDQRAENHTGVEIDQVSYHGGNEFMLEYTYQYHIYNGCADMDGSGEKSEHTTFTLQPNGTLEIEILEITNARSNRLYED